MASVLANSAQLNQDLSYFLTAVWGARPQVSIGDYDNKRYCSSVQLQSLTAAQTSGAYSQFSIPLSSFACPFPTSQASQVRPDPSKVSDSEASQVSLKPSRV